MAKLITQIIDDSEGGVTVLGHFRGQGGQLDAVMLLDMSTLSPVPRSLSLLRLTFSGSEFGCTLLWESAVNDVLFHMEETSLQFDFTGFKGLPNPQSMRATGNILCTTSGLEDNKTGSIILELLKVNHGTS